MSDSREKLQVLVIKALNATSYEYGDFAPECGSHSSTWVERFTVQLEALLAAPPVQGAGTPPLNQRGWDLLRQMRHNLHNEQLITDDEYTYLLTEIKGSVKRLEDYDAAIAAAHQSPVEALRKAVRHSASLYHRTMAYLSSMSAHAGKTFDDCMEIECFEARRALAAQKPPAPEFCKFCGAGMGVHRRKGEGTCSKCDPSVPND